MISKKVRAEAVEFAGCMATWWFSCPLGCEVYPTTIAECFCFEATQVAWSAFFAASCGDGDGQWWAEAQAMLLDGWTP